MRNSWYSRPSLLKQGTALCGLGALLAGPALAVDVSAERLAKPEAENWLHPHHDWSSTSYSPLNLINRDNVRNLKIAYLVGMRTVNNANQIDQEGRPLVDGGMIYFTDSWGRMYKVDGTDGKRGRIVWFNDPSVVQQGKTPRTRGIAMGGNAIYNALLDGRVVAVNRDSGETVWDQQIAGKSIVGIAENFTVSPIVTDRNIIVAQSAGDAGTRGWVAALDPATGKESWRFYTVPEKGQPGNETWKDDHDAWKTGGGSLWAAGSYDPDQKVTIWGTGNPVPMFDPVYRPGDNLYTNSTIALDVASGKLAWYFQYTPNDSWDFDEIGIQVLADIPIGGQTRKTVLHFARNGFFYELDRINGSFVQSSQYTDKVNWTKGIDPKTGKPVEYNAAVNVQAYAPEARAAQTRVCPTHRGGLRWQPPAYNGAKFIAYAGGAEGCSEIAITPPPIQLAAGQGPGTGGKRTVPEYYGSIKAIDVRAPKTLASKTFQFEIRSGMLATGGGVVYTAHADGTLGAYNDETLDELWTLNLGTNLKAPPMTFAVNGKQYIAVLTGGATDVDQPKGLEKIEQTPMLVVLSN